jgi:hypothetical protein
MPAMPHDEPHPSLRAPRASATHPGLLGALLLGACGGSIAPPDTGFAFYPQASPSEDSCEEAVLRIEHVDEPTALGFSAIDVLTRVAGSHASPLVWLDPVDSPEYELAYGPERGASTLSVEVRATAGDILHRYRAPIWNAPEGTECDAGALEIPVEVTLQSGAHALDETFATVLAARVPQRATFSKTFAPSALGGGLAFSKVGSLDPERSFWLAQLRADVLLWEGGSSGALSGQVGAGHAKPSKRQRPPPEPATDPGTFAVWPSPEPCEAPQSALPSDARLMGFSARDVLSVLERQPDRELMWSDGSVTALSLEFVGLEDHLCQAFDDVLEFDVAVRAKTSDGRIDTRLPVRIAATPANGTIGEIAMSREPEATLTVARLEPAGVFDAALGANGSVLVDIEMTQRGTADAGSISLRAFDGVTADASTYIAKGQWARQ